jgi:hypothetical protein
LIYLIDPYGPVNTGHFWKITSDFHAALTHLNLKFILMSPTPDMEINESAYYSTVSRINIEKIPLNSEDKNLFFDSFANKLNTVKEKSVVIFTWLPSNTPEFYSNLFSKITNKDVAFFGISTLKSSSVLNYDKNYSFELQEFFDEYENFKVMWVWHEPNRHEFSGTKLRRLPEFHSVNIDSNLLNKKNDSIRLNFYGGLSSFRGLGEILLIALFNPRLAISIKGYGFSKFKVWRPVKFKYFIYLKWRQKPLAAIFIALVSLLLSTLRYLPNVEFDPEPFESQDEFEKAIATSNFVFYGCKLPHSSGLALTALAAGVPVIWFGEKGEAVRILEKAYPAGRINYRDIFVVGRVKKILKNSNGYLPKSVFTWEMMLEEISTIRRYL